MKNFYAYVFIVSVFLTSCRVDEFSPCDEINGMEGLLCKEFRFEKGVSIGYLTSYYNSERVLTRIDYNSIDGKVKKYDTYSYADGKLKKESAYDAESNLLREKTFTYDGLQNLSSVNHIEQGVEISLKTYEYNDTLLQKESNFEHNELENYTTYQYFIGETRLYRKSVFSASDELLSYTTIEYFVNNSMRYNNYTGDHAFTGYQLFRFFSNGDTLSVADYNAAGNIVSLTEYQYNSSGKPDIKTEYDSDGKETGHDKYIYFE